MSQPFDRFMLYHGIGTDEKFASLTDGEFRAHVAGVLAIASTSPVRGYLLVGEIEAEPIHVARKAGVTERVATSAIRKLRQIGVLLRDEEVGAWRVHNWERHQPERSDPTAARRAKDYRDKRRASRDASRDEPSSATFVSRSPRARGLPEGVEVEVGSGVGVANAPPTPGGLSVTIGEVVAVLDQCDRLHRDRVGIENAVIAWPDRDPVLAARTVVTWVSDPAFRSTNAAKLLGDALSKQKPTTGETHADVTRRRLQAVERLGGANA